ncbi:hypothetical protein H2201_000656 [Coniosporium apollinis]|uniref:Uncharacterized protein n=1 Tax=Coniosporium apollinis TaxID=61459 RepID=A0ABQ9P6U1_9PEZI|nr:hypothetical protein H2201_000656 [Coniosporium apollinis]
MNHLLRLRRRLHRLHLHPGHALHQGLGAAPASCFATQAQKTTDALLQLLDAQRYTTDTSPRLNQNKMTGTDMMCTVKSSTATCHIMVPRDMNIT